MTIILVVGRNVEVNIHDFIDEIKQEFSLTIGQIQKLLSDGQFEFSLHAFHRAVERDIGEIEIREVGKHAIIIEEYPAD